MEVTSEEFSKMHCLFESKEYHIFTITDLISREGFINKYENKICYYSQRGNTVYVIGSIKFGNLLDNPISDFYIWQPIENGNTVVTPLITNKVLRSSNIYLGNTNTGSHLHSHSFAINFLISGRKMWYMIPNTEFNNKLLADEDFVEAKKLRLFVKTWLQVRTRFLKKLEGVKSFIQEAGQVVTIPDNMYHLTLNLEQSMGITFSWF